MNETTASLAAGKLQFRLTLIFLLLAACLFGLLGIYWIKALEPRLLSEASSNASALAQSHAQTIADALTLADVEGTPEHLTDVLDEVLILIDPNTGAPFVHGIAINANEDALRHKNGLFDRLRGDTHCPDCFETQIPLYSRHSHELVGAATFYSSSLAFQRLRYDVRARLQMASVIAAILLFVVWRAVTSLFMRVKASEEAASAATRAKSQFLATMSHEIRTPMNGILGMSHLLARSELSDSQREQVKIISTSGEALLSILNDILDLSRIEAGKLTVESKDFELRTLIGDILLLMSARAKEKSLQLQTAIDPSLPAVLHGDSPHLRQILLNLIGNAIKFTEQGAISVRATRLPDNPQYPDGTIHLSIAVIDSGIGITPEQQKILFEPFSQADAGTARHYGGTGLGLAICRRLVEAMGGEIMLTSTPGQGSTFTVHMPMQIGSSRPAEHTATAPTPLPPLHILVTDDSEINRRVAAELLRHEGHQVREAASGTEAIATLRLTDIDVVLMDLQMPELDGIATTRQIRSLPIAHKATIPIIALTANILQEEMENCRAAGMDGYIIKPFTPEALNQELQRVLRRPARVRTGT